MKKTIYTTLSLIFIVIAACNTSSTSQETVGEATNEESTTEMQETPTVEESSNLGNFKNLVGEWTVDAATAGVKMDLTFNDDGGFKQVMGTINQEGTWEVVDDTHIKVATPNTKGQTWLITDLTDASVNICWNPDSPKPKTIPMQRVK